jgi:dynein heavy chain
MAQGNVEFWLGSLLREALHSVHVVIKNAHIAVDDPNLDLIDFLNTSPAQVTAKLLSTPTSTFFLVKGNEMESPKVDMQMNNTTLPFQIGILGIQFIWTRDSEIALNTCRQDKKIMNNTDQVFLEMLNMLIDVTTQNLSKIERRKFETLITIHLHQRDIFHDLVSGVHGWCRAKLMNPHPTPRLHSNNLNS